MAELGEANLISIGACTAGDIPKHATLRLGQRGTRVQNSSLQWRSGRSMGKAVAEGSVRQAVPCGADQTSSKESNVSENEACRTLARKPEPWATEAEVVEKELLKGGGLSPSGTVCPEAATVLARALRAT